MEQLELSSNPYHRRLFILLNLAAFMALISLRFFILPLLFYNRAVPSMEVILNAVLEGFIIALVSSITVTFFMLWLNPAAKEQVQIKVLSPGKELKEFLRQDLAGSNEFWYRGHTAKWTRSRTLPVLAQEARSTRSARNVFIIILNPNNRKALELLAEWDHERNPKLNISAQVNFIQKQLIATILSVLDSKIQEPLLHVEIGLHNNFSFFRVDLSSKSAIITRSSPKESAIRFSAASDFYRSYYEDLRVSFSQSRQIPLGQISEMFLAELQVDKAKEILAILGIDHANLNDQELKEIIAIAQEPKDPYPD